MSAKSQGLKPKLLEAHDCAVLCGNAMAVKDVEETAPNGPMLAWPNLGFPRYRSMGISSSNRQTVNHSYHLFASGGGSLPKY